MPFSSMPRWQGLSWNPIKSSTSYDSCMVGIVETNLEHAKLMTDRDHRSPRKPFAEYVESHSDDVTEVRRPEHT